MSVVMAAALAALATLLLYLSSQPDVVNVAPAADSQADTDLALAARAAGALISEPTEITYVGADGADVLAALTASERVFGDDQESIEAMRLVVVHVPAPTRGVDYSRPEGVEAETIVSALLVVDPSGDVIASELATPAADQDRDAMRMNLMGEVKMAMVDPLP